MRKRTLLTAIALLALAAVVATTATAANGRKASKKTSSAVQVAVFAPRISTKCYTQFVGGGPLLSNFCLK